MRIIIFPILILIFLIGCTLPSEKEAVKVAQGFSVAWQNEDYASVYDYIHPEVREVRSKEDFIAFTKAKQSSLPMSFIFDKVVMQERNEAYAYYSAQSGIITVKMPPAHLLFHNGKWYLDALAIYFTDTCVAEDCHQAYKDAVGMDLTLYCFDEYFPDLNWEDCEEAVDKVIAEHAFRCDKSTGYLCEDIT